MELAARRTRRAPCSSTGSASASTIALDEQRRAVDRELAGERRGGVAVERRARRGGRGRGDARTASHQRGAPGLRADDLEHRSARRCRRAAGAREASRSGRCVPVSWRAREGDVRGVGDRRRGDAAGTARRELGLAASARRGRARARTRRRRWPRGSTFSRRPRSTSGWCGAFAGAVEEALREPAACRARPARRRRPRSRASASGSVVARADTAARRR